MRWVMQVAILAAGCGHGPGVSNAGSSDATVTDNAPRSLPVLQSATELCKLLNNRNVFDPTPNAVQFRSNVLGADLGIPVVNGDDFFLFFGDTIGFAGIWGFGQSHPDSVGHAHDTAATVAADPSVLCHDLQILSLPPSESRGPMFDSRVQADFAGAVMFPPPGLPLLEFIRNPAGGTTRFANLPGDYEVPSGAFAYGGAIYIFYTTVASPADVRMIGSYLARWTVPVASGSPWYQILYGVDERSDAAGPLGGDFINIAAVPDGDYVYLFGTGAFRASPVSLARKRLDALATPGGFERTGEPIIATPGYGETSVRYFAAIDRWMFLAEEEIAGSNRIVARFADHAAGPWSDAIVVHDMFDPTFRARYCCAVANDCQGVEFMNCRGTGFYGSYLFPELALGADGSFTVTYTMSSFDPYNVALFQATFR